MTSGAAWYDAVYLSSDDKFDAGDVLLSEFVHDGAARGRRRLIRGEEQVSLPNGIFGAYHLLLRTDARSQITETGAEGNNVASAATTITLSPYADLIVSSVAATSDIVVGNPGPDRCVVDRDESGDRYRHGQHLAGSDRGFGQCGLW